MAKSFSIAACAAVIGLLSVAVSPQSLPQEQNSEGGQPPTFRAGVNFVRVDVVVTDKSGSQVSDLTPDDFEVTEGGKPQKIETFKLISLDGGVVPGPEGAPVAISSDAVEEVEAARDDVRLFAIFLDDYHVSREWSHVVREQLARFVEKQLGPTDMIGVMYPLTALASVRMNRNHEAVVNQLLRFEGRMGDYAPKNGFEENYVYRIHADVARIRREVSFSALKGLIMHMGGLKQGRQALILVSEGYGGDGGTMLGNLTEISELANRNNTAIYTVNPQVLPPPTQWMPSSAMESLSFLAERSGGRALFDQTRTGAELRERQALVTMPRSSLATVMKQIVVDSSAYYLLGYNSTLTIPDGKYHKIEVKVKRPAVQVHYRRGSWAEEARVTTIPPAAPNVVETALAAAAIPRSRPARTWIGLERGEGGLTRVIFSWEPMLKPPGDFERDSERPTHVAVTATGPGGATYFSGRVPDQDDEATSGSSVAFEVPPGPMQLRLIVENSDSEILDAEVRNLTVTDLTAPHTLFGTPQVFRARSVPELQRLRTEVQPVPVVAREFRRTDRLLIRVPAYGAGTPPHLSAQLIGRPGQTMAELPISATDADSRLPEIEVSLAHLPAGDYAVRILAANGGDDATEIVAFRVTN